MGNWLLKGKKLLWVILLFIIIGVGLSGCGLRSKSEPEANNQPKISNVKRQLVLSNERSQVLIYFATPDHEYLLPVTMDINPTKEVAKVAVEKLLAGPNNDFLASTMPEGTKLKDIYFSEASGTVYVDLTKSFLGMANEEEVRLALDSLVYTLTELPGVNQVQIYVEGETLEKMQGFSLDEPLVREHGINFAGKSQRQEEQLTVFFSDENAMFMVPITFNGPNTEDISLKAKAALDLLMKGPPKKGKLSSVLWEGTKILNLEWEEQQKTVVVDFNQKVMGYGGGTAFERQLVNALLYTLTSLPGVEKLQILIEGEKRDYLPEGTDIYEPLIKPNKFNYNQPG